MDMNSRLATAVAQLQQASGGDAEASLLAEAVLAGLLFDLSPTQVVESLGLEQVAGVVQIEGPEGRKDGTLRMGQVAMLLGRASTTARFELASLPGAKMVGTPSDPAYHGAAVTLMVSARLDQAGKHLSAWVQIPQPPVAILETSQAA